MNRTKLNPTIVHIAPGARMMGTRAFAQVSTVRRLALAATLTP
jgi:hypothetical protein